MNFTTSRALVQDLSLGVSMGANLQKFYGKLATPQPIESWQLLMTEGTVEIGQLALAALRRLYMSPERVLQLSVWGAALDLLVWRWLDATLEAYVHETWSKRGEHDTALHLPRRHAYLHLTATLIVAVALAILLCRRQVRVPGGFLIALAATHLSSRFSSPQQHRRYLRWISSKEQLVTAFCHLSSGAEWLLSNRPFSCRGKSGKVISQSADFRKPQELSITPRLC